MKLSLLRKIVRGRAHYLKECAGYSGERSDGGSSDLLRKLRVFEDGIVVKLDLRPSEFSQLDNIEVGEPDEFTDIINLYKTQLALGTKL